MLKALGYSQKSLRDWESRGAEDKVKDQVKDVGGNGEPRKPGDTLA
jgi:hypothetical protein